jgi:hypothetical protein
VDVQQKPPSGPGRALVPEGARSASPGLLEGNPWRRLTIGEHREHLLPYTEDISCRGPPSVGRDGRLRQRIYWPRRPRIGSRGGRWPDRSFAPRHHPDTVTTRSGYGSRFTFCLWRCLPWIDCKGTSYMRLSIRHRRGAGRVSVIVGSVAILTTASCSAIAQPGGWRTTGFPPRPPPAAAPAARTVPHLDFRRKRPDLP